MSTPTVGRRRTWTDEQLRADELGLDTSHFTGRRKWTDGQLRRAVADGTSWGEVIRLLRMFDNGENRPPASSRVCSR